MHVSSSSRVKICNLVNPDDNNTGPNSQQTPPPATHQLHEVAVLVSWVQGEPGNEQQIFLPFHSPNMSLLALANQVSHRFGVPAPALTIIALISPRFQRFELNQLTSAQANEIVFPPCMAFRVWINPHAAPVRCEHEPPIQQHQHQTQTTTTPFASQAEQDQLREVFTKLLADPRYQISLSTIAKIANRSKSSVSLWRRGTYTGNNSAIAKSVAEAIEFIQSSDPPFNNTAKADDTHTTK